MIRQPLVSICIPVYNKAQFVEETIQSVMSQTYKNWELIFCDNASTDGTVDIIKKYLSNDRIRLIENEQNFGLNYNFRKVYNLASGKYLKMLFADDVIYPTCLEKQVAVLEAPENSDVILSSVARSVINQNSRLIMKMRYSYKPGITKSKDAVKKCFLWGTNRIGETHAVLFRNMKLDDICDWENLQDCDIGIWCSLLKFGDLHYHPEYLSAFRLCPGSLTSTMKLDYPKQYTRVFTVIYNEKIFNISYFLLNWCKFMCYVRHFARSLFLKFFVKN